MPSLGDIFLPVPERLPKLPKWSNGSGASKPPLLPAAKAASTVQIFPAVPDPTFVPKANQPGDLPSQPHSRERSDDLALARWL